MYPTTPTKPKQPTPHAPSKKRIVLQPFSPKTTGNMLTKHTQGGQKGPPAKRRRELGLPDRAEALLGEEEEMQGETLSPTKAWFKTQYCLDKLKHVICQAVGKRSMRAADIAKLLGMTGGRKRLAVWAILDGLVKDGYLGAHLDARGRRSKYYVEKEARRFKWTPSIDKKVKVSKGIHWITTVLKEQGIAYVLEKKWDGCRDKKKLPFDIYLPEYNVVIEYDGRQHFEPVKRWGGEAALESCREHDRIKDKFLLDNEIHLLRIAYTCSTFERIGDVVNRFLTNVNEGSSLVHKREGKVYF